MTGENLEKDKPFTDELPRLKWEDLDKIAQVSQKAFFNDPYAKYVFPNEQDRRKKSIYSERAWLRIGLKFGEAYVTSENLEGFAIWFKPGFDITIPNMIRNGMIGAYFRMGIKSALRDFRIDAFSEKVKKGLNLPSHAYLGMLAVDPKHQGKGYASKLLKPVLKELDKTGTDCYLETTGENNASMYAHFGFETLKVAAFPGTDLKMWSMWRKAGKGVR